MLLELTPLTKKNIAVDPTSCASSTEKTETTSKMVRILLMLNIRVENSDKILDVALKHRRES